jgi:hypothetical protein
MRQARKPMAGGNERLEELARILGTTKHQHQYIGSELSIPEINVLPQPRRTFEHIEELALDVAKKKLLNPPTVAQLSRADCEDFLKVINMLWGASFEMKGLRPSRKDGREIFYILLAGERRYRSCRHLWENGCAECLETNGKEKPGTCFNRHFTSGKIEVRLCVNIPPLAALFLQLSENTHMRVPPHEEAYAYAQLYKLLRQANADFTIARFAREVGRSPETIRNAIQFCELPLSVREPVEKGQVPYGIALEISRLHRNNVEESELKWWVTRAITEEATVPQFRESITKYLFNLTAGQTSLLEIMNEIQIEESRRSHIRQTVEVHSIRGIWAFIGYFEKVFALFEQGKLGQKDSPFSEGSPVRVFRKLTGHMRLLLPHMKKFVPKRDYPRIERTVAKAEQLASRIEAAG